VNSTRAATARKLTETFLTLHPDGKTHLDAFPSRKTREGTLRFSPISQQPFMPQAFSFGSLEGFFFAARQRKNLS